MKRSRLLFSVFLLAYMAMDAGAQMPDIVPLPRRAQVVNRWLEHRLETILPDLMRRAGIDAWLVICREYNEDPVYLTLVPEPVFSARRLTILLFVDRGKEGVKRFSVSRYPIGRLYKNLWDPQKMGQWERLARTIRELDPKRIGIDVSETFALADGLSATLKEKLVRVLGSKYASRLVSAEKIAIGWLETRTPEELEVYPQLVAIAHQIIAEAFSNRVITPGVTTTQDVSWWIRQRFEELDLDTWFQPSVDIQRPDGARSTNAGGNVIRRGDLLHCDIGIQYLRLCTDTQQHAYVLREDETDVPEGLKRALAIGNRLQDILLAEFREGRTGNEILKAALERAKAEGINGSIYSHPLGFHGHAAGPTIGLWDHQEGVPGKGDYPVHNNTCYSIELSVKVSVPEWNGQKVRIALEEDAVFRNGTISFLHGRQTKFHIIR